MATTTIHTFTSYEVKGTKESFANWVSCLSPCDTPFASMVKKVSIGNTKFQWQSDALKEAQFNSVGEGTDAEFEYLEPTTQHEGYTQIFRKTGAISDTVDAMDYWGRVSETKYQLSKMGEELKRDIEYSFLSFQGADKGSYTKPFISERKTGGFLAQLGPLQDYNPNNPTQNFFTVNNLVEDALKDMLSNLYTLGSNANIIMFHPTHAKFFSDIVERSPVSNEGRKRMFNNVAGAVNKWVVEYKDAFGRKYTLLPNRFCQKNVIYFFNPLNFRQMLLREPKMWELDKTGSNTKYMTEVEVGLRHANPQVSGAIVIKDLAATPVFDKGNVVSLHAGGALTITETGGVVGQWSANSANISFGQATPTDANVIQVDASAPVGASYTITFVPTTPIQNGKYYGQATITVNVVAANAPITTRMAHINVDALTAPVAAPAKTKAQTPKRSRKTAQKLAQAANGGA